MYNSYFQVHHLSAWLFRHMEEHAWGTMSLLSEYYTVNMKWFIEFYPLGYNPILSALYKVHACLTPRPWRWRQYILLKGWLHFSTRLCITEDRALRGHCCVNTKSIVKLLFIQYLNLRKWPEFSIDLHNSTETKSVLYAVYCF